jgi:hypothetical protein
MSDQIAFVTCGYVFPILEKYGNLIPIRLSGALACSRLCANRTGRVLAQSRGGFIHFDSL